jgi:hypothetical protein
MKMSLAWMEQKLSKRLVVAVAIALGPLVLVGRELLQGRVLFWGTPSLQFVPWWMEGLRQVAGGNLPLWNELNGIGAPLLANYQTAFFYPPNWLLCLLGLIQGAPGVAWGYTLLAMLHLIWGGWGMASLLRRLGSGALAQAVGGTAFALGGYFVGRLEFISMVWVGAWIPWVLRYADELASPVNLDTTRQKGGWFHFRLIGCLALQLMAGHAQLSWYTLELATVWVALGGLWGGGWRAGLRGVGRFGVAVAAAALIAAVQLVPTAEYLSQSQRSSAVDYQSAMTYSFWPWRLVTVLAPDFFGNPGKGNFWGYSSYWEDHIYIGMTSMILGLGSLGAVFGKRKPVKKGGFSRRMIVFLWGVIVTATLLALGSNTPVFPFLYRYVPTFALFQAPARMMIWVVIALILVAANGIDTWRYPGGRGLYWLRLGTVGALAVAVGSGLGWLALNNVKLTFVQAMAFAGLWALGTGLLALLARYKDRSGWKIVWPLLVYLWVLIDLLTAGWLLNPTVRTDFYRGPGLESKTLHGERIYLSDRDEYALKFYRFLRFQDFQRVEDWRSLRHVVMPNLNLLDQVASVNNFDPLIPARYAVWMQALEEAAGQTRQNMLVRMNVGATEAIDGRSLSGVRFDRVEGGFMAAWYECAEMAPDGGQALEMLTANNFALDRLIIEGEKTTLPMCSPTPAVVLENVKAGPGEINIQGFFPKAGWVFISQIWYPGWTAQVNGSRGEVLKTDVAFMAIAVPAGNVEIHLQYEPISFRIGGLLSILVLVLLLIAFYSRSRSQRPMEIPAVES